VVSRKKQLVPILCELVGRHGPPVKG